MLPVNSIGRTDDVITLASGEKTVPAPMEGVIASSPLAQGVVMFGWGQDQVGVLIEPRPGHVIDVNNENAVTEFRNRIWCVLQLYPCQKINSSGQRPVIEEANKSSPAFSRIFKEMILIASKNKPMLRAPKGTVQRKATLSNYEGEINAL